MSNQYKIVEFHKFCETCKHKDVDEVKDPCCECLDNPAMVDSHKPMHYEEEK